MLNVWLLLTNTVKNSRWVSYTFIQKSCSFKCFRILEENCGADIINGTCECKFFVDRWCKKRSSGELYFPAKARSFQSFQNSNVILKKFLRLYNQQLRGNQYLKVLMVSKCDEIKFMYLLFFHFFWSDLMIFEFKGGIFVFLFFLAKKPGYKKVDWRKWST